MTRLFGVDVSRYQSPSAPAGVPWKTIREKSSFVIVRATYGTSPDPQAASHIAAARALGFVVGLYHFFVATQPVSAQLDVFCAQANKCGVGKGDIVPALDCEDDGKVVLAPALEPLIHQACDVLIGEFGNAMPYITQVGWYKLGKPSWMLSLPLWVAHYTNAAKPATPGNMPATLWQNRVGKYAPGAPFVESEAMAPGALDQDVCDVSMPLATSSPTMPQNVVPTVDPHPDQPALWQQRLDELTNNAYAGLDMSHADESFEGMS